MARRVLCLFIGILIAFEPGSAEAYLLDTGELTRNSPANPEVDQAVVQPFFGDLGYRHRFQLPPGTAGLTPDLTLTYSARRKGSAYGFGWNLNLSAIERSTRNGPPTYDASDVFELDGEELIPDPEISDRYHLRHSDYSRIVFDQTGWTVTRTDGTVLRFGLRTGANSRLDHPDASALSLSNPTFRWALDEVEDPRGNSYRIEYEAVADPDDGARTTNILPRRLTYSHHPSAPASQSARLVEFCWQERGNVQPGGARPDCWDETDDGSEGLDRPTSYRSRFKVQVTKRIAEIRVGVESLPADGAIDVGEQLARHVFSYVDKATPTDPGAPPFSALSQIQRYGRNDEAFPVPTEFGYTRQERNILRVRELAFKPPNGVVSADIRANVFQDTVVGMYDMNGDGILDRVHANASDGFRWHVSLGRPVGHPDHPTTPAGYHPGTAWLWCQALGGLNCVQFPIGSNHLIEVTTHGTHWTVVSADLVDMDGDGLVDRIESTDSGDWTFRKNLGNRFDAPLPWTPPALAPHSQIPEYARHIASELKPPAAPDHWQAQSMLADVNGDGKPDHIAIRSADPNGIWISYNQGCTAGAYCGFGPPVAASGRMPSHGLSHRAIVAPIVDQTVVQHDLENFVDVNGDGLPDMFSSPRDVSGNAACLDTGFGTGKDYPAYTYLDGGGYDSGVRTCSGTVGVGSKYASVKTSTTYVEPAPTFSVHNGDVQTMTDVNGDGVLDRYGYVSTDPVTSTVALGLGDGHFLPEVAYFSHTYPVRNWKDGRNSHDLIDVTGDGIPDLVERFHDGAAYEWWVTPGLPADGLLNFVKNEAGGTTSVSYQSSARYAWNGGQGPIQPPPGLVAPRNHVWVVSAITRSDGRSGTPDASVTYTYEDPGFDVDERRFAGFGAVMSQHDDGTVMRTEYHQDSARRGRPISEVTSVASTTLQTRTWDWDHEEIHNENSTQVPGADFVFLESDQTITHDPSGGSATQVRERRREYDGFGNMTLDLEFGPDGVEGTSDDLERVTVYGQPNTTDWLLAYPTERYTEISGESFGNHELIAYDEHLGSLGTSVVAGLVSRRTTRRYLPGSGTPEDLVEQFDYDAFGNRTEIWTPRQFQLDPSVPSETTTYDTATNTFATSTTTVTGQVEEARFDEWGAPTRQTNSAGHLSCSSYDAFSRLVSQSENGQEGADDIDTGSCDRLLSQTDYLDVGIATAQRVVVTDFTDATNGLTGTSWLDGLGRTYAQSSEASATLGDDFVTVRSWDSRGNLECESLPYRGVPTNDLLCSATHPHRLSSYDSLNRPTGTTLVSAPGTSVVEVTTTYSLADHDGIPATEELVAHSVIAGTPDLIRERGISVAGDVVSSSEGNQLVLIRRDGKRRVTRIDGEDVALSPSGTHENLLDIEYTSLDERHTVSQRASESDPGRTWQYTWDPDRLLASEDGPASGDEIDYYYDALGRLEIQDEPPLNGAAGGGPEDSFFTYEPGTGRLSTVDSEHVETIWGYNSRGEIASRVRNFPGNPGYAFSYSFDFAGRPLRTRYPDGTHLETLYDGGIPEAVANVATGDVYLSDIDLHDSGRVRYYTAGAAGTYTERTFRASDHRLERALTRDSGGIALQDWNYSYDTAGNVLAQDDGTNNWLDQVFEYDARHQLSKATGTQAFGYGVIDYVYDEAGNLRQRGDLEYEYGGGGAPANAATLVRSISNPTLTLSLAYDAAGRLESRVGTIDGKTYDDDFGWNALNQIETVTSAVRPDADYAYDENGARIDKTVAGGPPGTTRRYVDDTYEEVGTDRLKHVFIQGERLLTLVDAADIDQDADGIPDRDDLCVGYPGSNTDTDGDGIPDVCQCGDSTEDGVFSLMDVFLTSDCITNNTLCDVSITDTQYGTGAPGDGSVDLLDMFAANDAILNSTTTFRCSLTCSRSGGPDSDGRAVCSDGSPVAQRELYYHSDGVGSNTLVTDAAGAVVQRTLISPYGRVLATLDGTGAPLAEANWSTERFLGDHAYDSETDFYQARRRFLDPATGAFLSQDPELIGPGPGVTFSRIPQAAREFGSHRYGAANPMRFRDPTGGSILWWTGFDSLLDFGSAVADFVLGPAGFSTVNGSGTFGDLPLATRLFAQTVHLFAEIGVVVGGELARDATATAVGFGLGNVPSILGGAGRVAQGLLGLPRTEVQGGLGQLARGLIPRFDCCAGPGWPPEPGAGIGPVGQIGRATLIHDRAYAKLSDLTLGLFGRASNKADIEPPRLLRSLV